MTLVPAANCTGPTMLATASAAGCVASHQPRATADLDVHALPAGAWLLVADTYGGVPGPVQLDVSLAAPAAAAANDTCATSETIPLTATPWGSSGLVTGDTTGASPNHLGLVCASDGPDLSYRVTTAAGAGAVNMRVSIASQNSTANLPSIHVRTACDPAMGSQLGCAAVKIPGPLDSLGAVVQAWGLQPGTEQWIWVDGAASSLGGAFTMQVDVAGPAANDVCATAQTLPINTSVAGSTLGATNDYAGTAPTGFYTGAITCLSALPGADVVYRFTAATTGFHRVEVVPQLGFDPGLAVLTACTPNACLATNDRNRTNELEEIQFQAAAGTSYFIVVDSRSDAQTSGNSRGGFIISVIGP